MLVNVSPYSMPSGVLLARTTLAAGPMATRAMALRPVAWNRSPAAVARPIGPETTFSTKEFQSEAGKISPRPFVGIAVYANSVHLHRCQR